MKENERGGRLMGSFQSFEIKNYRGIRELKVEVGKMPVMLLGLNESGKSTILEAISCFDFSDDSVRVASAVQLIPVDQRARFSGPITVTAELTFDDNEKSAVAEILRTNNFSSKDCGYLKVTIEAGSSSDPLVQDSVGVSARIPAKSLAAIIPRVSYFSDFNVAIPKKIFLKSGHDDSVEMRFHRNAIESIIAEAYPSGGTLQDMIIDQVMDILDRSPGDLAAAIADSGEINAVLSNITARIDQRMADTWYKTFSGTNLRNLHIDAQIGYDEVQRCVYLSYRIRHGTIRYEPHMRSAGFRWFFCFLLSSFSADASALLLYDEPGNHLHGRAQIQMVEMLKAMSKSRQIVYSTHRPHLIEPAWLEDAYIVENKAYTSLNPYSPTLIVATKYPALVSNYGKLEGNETVSLTSHFQPATERLLINAPTILELDDCVVVEGKTDYYVYRYFASLYPRPLPRFYPANGTRNLDSLVDLLVWRRARFLVLCDGDHAGVKAVQRNLGRHPHLQANLLTLGDIDQEFAGKVLEDLISQETYINLDRLLGGRKRQKTAVKEAFSLLLSQQLPGDEHHDAVDEKTRTSMSRLFDGIIDRYSALRTITV